MPELFLFLSNKLTVLFKNSRDGVEINQKSILVVESLFIISYIYEYIVVVFFIINTIIKTQDKMACVM